MLIFEIFARTSTKRKMPKAFEEFKFTYDQTNGPVSEFWENVHLAAKALKEETNCPNKIIASGLRAVAAEWD